MLSRNELKELLISREPVVYFNERLQTDLEYRYISAVITRFEPETGAFEITAELTDYSGHSVTIVPADRVRRKAGKNGSIN